MARPRFFHFNVFKSKMDYIDIGMFINDGEKEELVYIFMYGSCSLRSYSNKNLSFVWQNK